MADDKRCGTCRHHKPHKFNNEYGECRCPLPSAYELTYVVFTKTTEGTTCPCWQPKEDGDE